MVKDASVPRMKLKNVSLHRAPPATGGTSGPTGRRVLKRVTQAHKLELVNAVVPLVMVPVLKVTLAMFSFAAMMFGLMMVIIA